jgi:hypothetical protein
MADTNVSNFNSTALDVPLQFTKTPPRAGTALARPPYSGRVKHPTPLGKRTSTVVPAPMELVMFSVPL